MIPRSLASAAVIAALLFAGFGCKPVLDAQVQQQQAAQDRQRSLWLPEEPEFAIAMSPDGTGTATLDLKTQEGSSVLVMLTGPGVVRDPEQAKDVESDGSVRFTWQLNRDGHYVYNGRIIFNRVTQESFTGEADAY